jgi:hypothetical protein
MAMPDTAAQDLTDEELMLLLRQAVEDEREGRLVRCNTESQLRAFFGDLRRQDG